MKIKLELQVGAEHILRLQPVDHQLLEKNWVSHPCRLRASASGNCILLNVVWSDHSCNIAEVQYSMLILITYSDMEYILLTFQSIENRKVQMRSAELMLLSVFI